MAKCLRCGAGNEWIEGKTKPEPPEVDAEREKDKARIAELERKLNPRRWTKAESDAWHKAIPDVYEAFRALRESISL